MWSSSKLRGYVKQLPAELASASQTQPVDTVSFLIPIGCHCCRTRMSLPSMCRRSRPRWRSRYFLGAVCESIIPSASYGCLPDRRPESVMPKALASPSLSLSNPSSVCHQVRSIKYDFGRKFLRMKQVGTTCALTLALTLCTRQAG
jgi:hypothetical protein